MQASYPAASLNPGFLRFAAAVGTLPAKPAFGAVAQTESPVGWVTDASFEKDVIEASKTRPVMVHFHAPFSRDSRALAATVDQFATKQLAKDNPPVTVVRYNQDAENRGQIALTEIVKRYRVMESPVTILFKDGKPADRVVGNVPRATLNHMVRIAE